jgi:hypothetical protein
MRLHQALLTRIETQDRHALVATDQLGIGAGRTGNLTALAGFISMLWTIVPTGMNEAASHCPASRQRPCRTRDHLVAGSSGAAAPGCRTSRRLIGDQRDECGPVRIVFHPLDGGLDVELATLEIDHAVGALVTATATARRDAAGVVAAALGQALGQRLDRLALPQARTVNDNQLALARRRRIECFSAISVPFSLLPRGPYRPVVTSMD